MARLINEDIKIGHIVIEGHASEEGSFEYNYDLSNLRARAIFKALVQSGVHPDRISHRGYGEALPKNLGRDEESLSENRRVEFHIVRIDLEDVELELRPLNKGPWDGVPLDLITPQKTISNPEDPFDTDVTVPVDFLSPDEPDPQQEEEEDEKEAIPPESNNKSEYISEENKQ